MAIKQRRQIAVPQTEPAAVVLGLDIGYGVTKVCDGRQSIMFPSVWGTRRTLKFQEGYIHEKYPGETIIDDEGEWFVGELAASQLPTGAQRRLRGRRSDEATAGNAARVRLAKVALGQLYPNIQDGDVVQVRIATGLPVDHMHGAADLKTSLLGQHRIKTDRSDFVADVTEVMVMPQPYGTVYANMILPDGRTNPAHIAKRTGVCDIGTYTIDVALDDNGEFMDAYSGSTEAGMYMAQDVISSMYEQDYHEKPSYKIVHEAMITGTIRIKGKIYSIADDLERAIAPVRQAAVELMAEKWGAGNSVDAIYCSGGGAKPAFSDIYAAFDHAVLMDNAQMANAMGYRNYAMSRNLSRQEK